jgi:hypothetical protein
MMLRSASFGSLFIACALTFVALPASAQQPPSASAQLPTEVMSLAGLPAPVRQQLAADPGEISDRDGPFNPGCVMTAGVPSKRFVRALVGKGVARVDVEQGGIAHYVETLEFREAGGNWKLVRRENAALPPT